MHSLIYKLLQKRGIEKVDDLEPEERETFNQWQSVLGKENLTIDDIKAFCSNKIAVIEGKWADLNLENTKKAELIPYHTILKTILTAIDSPQVVRKQLEQQLEQLINQ